jgi:lipoate-protein ligase A
MVPVVSQFIPARPAIVLGSTQERTLINESACLENNVEIVKRRSGGGIVLLSKESTLWIDIEIPRQHDLWLNDVGDSSLWLGEVFLHELTSLGQENLEIHRGALTKSKLSSLVCFAGRGPGEVFTHDGRKVVGISQRRTREWARFQCAVSLKWDPYLLRKLLQAPQPEIEELVHCGSDIECDSEMMATKLIEAIQATLSSQA